MPYLSHGVARDEIQPGDHIYTWRSGFAYTHHGIFVGENRVVHFTCGTLSDSTIGIIASSSSSSSHNLLPQCPDCGFDQLESGVVISCMDCFLAGSSLRRFQYGTRGFTLLAKRPGTCTTAISDAPQVVIHRAMHLRCNGFGTYNLFSRNCEDFALYCKTGRIMIEQDLAGSGQVSSLLDSSVSATVFSFPVLLFARNPVVKVATGVCAYAYCRYALHIGGNKYATRVEVEALVELLSQA